MPTRHFTTPPPLEKRPNIEFLTAKMLKIRKKSLTLRPILQPRSYYIIAFSFCKTYFASKRIRKSN